MWRELLILTGLAAAWGLGCLILMGIVCKCLLSVLLELRSALRDSMAAILATRTGDPRIAAGVARDLAKRYTRPTVWDATPLPETIEEDESEVAGGQGPGVSVTQTL